MRKYIEALINSGITAYRVSKDTGIPQNTATRIFNGEASIDNISLKNAEILSNYYIQKMEELNMTTFKNFEEALEYIREHAQLDNEHGVEHYENVDEFISEKHGKNLSEDDYQDAYDVILNEITERNFDESRLKREFILFDYLGDQYHVLSDISKQAVDNFISEITAP